MTDPDSNLIKTALIYKYMKNLVTIVTAVVCASFTNNVFAQDPRETEIRRLDNHERESVLKGDTTALFDKLWSPNMVVNTPLNVVGTVEGTKHNLRIGGLNYLSFERNIEKITFSGDVAIVMGEEKIRPQGKQRNAGKVVTRRFTNVWQKQNKRWSMIARHATIIKVE